MAKNNQEIDESSFLASIRARNKESTKEPDSQQENINIPAPTRKKKGKTDPYPDLFFQLSSYPARIGKSISIREEYHELLSKYLQVVTGNKVTLFNYIDNILSQHFEEYQDEINKLYKEHFKDLI